MFPGARSICFAPIWDDKRERWYAGALASTYENYRIFDPSVELSYLRAFGTLLMADVHRLETTRSHQAQSDVLGSISHELRSPLHGLILSTELLADTRIDTFQGNILHTLENCGRTLLDTVDHLLDYSKVNHFMDSDRRRKARGTHGKGLSIEDGMMAQVSDVRLDTLVEEVVESVFAGFRRMSTEYSLHNDRSKATDPDIGAGIASGSGLGDTTQHSSSPPIRDNGMTLSLPASVAVYVDIEPSESYKCRTISGAIRRVVMNLFGNSLKYTERGRIDVRLCRDLVATRRRGAKQNMVRLVVADTGKGMSQDFLANYLYKPFAQADQLSAGTGVGLSLVKKLVSSLGGEISVKSQLGVGSEVTVLLPLPSADHEAAEHKEEEVFRAQREMLKGLRVSLVGHGHTPDEVSAGASAGVSTVEKICKGWLGMEVVSDLSGFTPDVIMCMESSLDVALGTQAFAVKPPIVVVCTDAVVAHSRTMNSTLSHCGQVYEFISQPRLCFYEFEAVNIYTIHGDGIINIDATN
ncbi:Histidine kinase [Apiospora saccharicola]|uniref:histidine kinase n=1 Tax=Apiospora saccharicola TaxID=335842 RepID=A0ABR1VAY2_9PEZI